MGDPEAGVYAAVYAQGGEDFRIGADAGLEDGGREAVERECRIAAEVAVEAARDPPEGGAQDAAGEEEREAQQQGDMGELVAEFPQAQLSRGGLTGRLHDPV